MSIISASEARFKSRIYRLGHPNWMPAPELWRWCRPDGQPQGFGLTWRDNPGLANLLWLSMDLGRPPEQYDASANVLYTTILVLGAKSRVGATPLFDAAGMHSLQEFHDMLPLGGANALESTYPLLKLLAKRRLRDENT